MNLANGFAGLCAGRTTADKHLSTLRQNYVKAKFEQLQQQQRGIASIIYDNYNKIRYARYLRFDTQSYQYEILPFAITYRYHIVHSSLRLASLLTLSAAPPRC